MSLESRPTFFERNDFLLRRLHSLSGLIPVGAYMVVHLLTNATVLESPAAYQKAVYQIHSFGMLLPVIEWVFIFIPLLFHAIFGVVIIRGSLPNSGTYRYGSNVRYTLQRATGMIAFVFIAWHVFHMHGWFHWQAWMDRVVSPLGGGQFRAYNAASSVAYAMRGFVVPALYTVGILASVFHLANGIWTMGITWGVWTAPAAQARALRACTAFGLLLAIVGLSALGGAITVDVKEAREVEDSIYMSKVKSREIEPNEHKRLHKPPETDVPATALRDAAP